MIFLIICYGLLIGSFLNVCIYRIPREESISFPPSHCTSCKHKIKAYDLIPVISYLLLRGRCRYCGERISPKYPIIEITTSLLFLLTYFKYGFTLEFIKMVVFVSFLIVIGLIDLETTDVYLKTTLSGIIAAVIFIIIGYFNGVSVSPWSYLFGGLLGGGLIGLIVIITHGMGWGDFEICLMAGLFLGLKGTAVMLFLSFVIGGLTGVFLILTKLKSRKDYIPFGPFIAVASLITIMFGNNIMDFYIQHFMG